MRLAGTKPVRGILLHHAQRCRERARAFSNRLAQRPEPRDINVRMPYSGHFQRGVIRTSFEFRGKDSTTLAKAAVIALTYGICDVVQRAQQQLASA